MNLKIEVLKNNEKINQVVILLHGYGADAKDLISLTNYWHRFLPDTLFILPYAPMKCQINSAGYEWFDLMQIDKSKSLIQLNNSITKLKILIENIIKKYGVKYEDIIFVGFSQGTMMALHTSLSLKFPVKGILGFSGKVYDVELLGKELNAKTKILFIHGTKDEVIKLEEMYDSYESLKKLNIDVDYKVLNCGHTISTEGMSLGLNFIRNLT